MDNYSAIRALSFPAVASALGIEFKKFQRKGKDWAGPCPIHGGKNANAFHYEVEGGRWHCFSCDAKGKGAIDLCIQMRSIGFKQAVEFLSAVEPSKEPTKEKEPPRGDSEASTRPVSDTGNDTGILKPYTGKYEKYAVPCPWLMSRIPDETITSRYGVFCYNNPARRSAYSGRVMLPVKDEHGLLFGYLGRSIDHAHSSDTKEAAPKYLFPSGLPKSRFLFGAAELKAGMFGPAPLRRIWIVESPFCVLKYASLGIPAVSPFGWSVSEEQRSLLASLCKGTVYLPDRNKAKDGVTVVASLAELLWVKAPALPDGIDDPENLSREQVLAL